MRELLAKQFVCNCLTCQLRRRPDDACGLRTKRIRADRNNLFQGEPRPYLATVKTAGGPSLHCTIPTEGVPSLRFLQGWAAMLPAQLLSVLHRP